MTNEWKWAAKEVDQKNDPVKPNGNKLNEPSKQPKRNSPKANLSLTKKKNS
jgi:hypothetical protein